MQNQVLLVGRFIKNIKKDDNEMTMFISVHKNYENASDDDIIRIDVSNHLENSVSEYCKKGDVVGVRGRIENKKGMMVIIGEKITFLASKGNDGV